MYTVYTFIHMYMYTCRYMPMSMSMYRYRHRCMYTHPYWVNFQRAPLSLGGRGIDPNPSRQSLVFLGVAHMLWVYILLMQRGCRSSSSSS